MPLAMFLAMQAVAGPGLAGASSPTSCRAGGEDIVVCAKPRERSRYRLPQIDDRDTGDIGRASFGVAGKARIAVETEQATVGGFPSQRAMVRLKLPF